MRENLRLAAALVALAAALWLLVPREASPPIGALASIVEAPRVPATIGGPAPDFVWVDVRGERQRLADLRGRVVVLNFWRPGADPVERSCLRSTSLRATTPSSCLR